MARRTTTTLDKQAELIHHEIADADKQLQSFKTLGKSKNGWVQVKMDGTHHVINIQLKSDKWHGNTTELINSFTEAFNDANDKVDDAVEKTMSSIIYRHMHRETDKI